MGRPLRVIIVEDSDSDIELLLRVLSREGYEVSHRRVETADDLRAAIAEQAWDLVLADYSLPRFSGPDALDVLKKSGLDLPFIVVSGSIGEETAVQIMKAGAHDFFLKDRLVRLASAIDRELREATVRGERRLAITRLEESERQLRQAVQARDEFLSIASHELKTPLTSMQLQLEALKRMAHVEPHASLSNAKVSGKFAMVTRQAQRLSALINNLLDVTRITAGRMDLQREPVDLSEVVKTVVARLEEGIAVSGCEVTVSASAPAKGMWDRFRIESVVSNLFSNALKYGSGKPVELSVQAIDDTARVSVTDKGIGISPKEQQRIFERFERAVPAEHYGGIGIGLWIVQQIVEAHGGVVRVQSTKGEGSTFIVELPTQGPPTQGAAP